MPYYAQINEAGICTVVTETHSELPAAANLIPIDGLRSDCIGKLYDAEASAAADAVLNTPVADIDNLATRKLYF